MNKKTKTIAKNYFEKVAWRKNLYTCGIDEVGRGCLAGPVVVAAVITPQNTCYALLKDSKTLNKEEREIAYNWIIKNCSWSVASSSHRIVDTMNIYQATLQSMKKVYLQLYQSLPFPQRQLKYVLIDAMPLDLHNGPEFHYFNYGETLSTSIAAASIIAKVTRDRLMEKMCLNFPDYTLEKHKGYATKSHVSSIIKHGPSIIHRRSFLSKIDQKKETKNVQQSLFGLP